MDTPYEVAARDERLGDLFRKYDEAQAAAWDFARELRRLVQVGIVTVTQGRPPKPESGVRPPYTLTDVASWLGLDRSTLGQILRVEEHVEEGQELDLGWTLWRSAGVTDDAEMARDILTDLSHDAAKPDGKPVTRTRVVTELKARTGREVKAKDDEDEEEEDAQASLDGLIAASEAAIARYATEVVREAKVAVQRLRALRIVEPGAPLSREAREHLAHSAAVAEAVAAEVGGASAAQLEELTMRLQTGEVVRYERSDPDAAAFDGVDPAGA